MKNEDDLHSLIKSLNKSEKKNFRQFISHRNIHGTNYLLLFDYLDKIKVYDKNKIIKDFNKFHFLKHLNVTKNYLFNLILESIYYYDTQSIPKFVLRKKIYYIKVLINKKQYSQAKKFLNKIRSEAQKYFFSDIILEIFDVEKTLQKYFPLKCNSGLKLLFEEKYLHLESMTASLTYDFLINEMEQYSEIIGIPFSKKNDFEEFRNKFEHRINNLDKMDYTPRVKEMRLNALIHYHVILINNKMALNYMIELVKLYDSFPEILSFRENVYAVNLINIIVICIADKNLRSSNYFFDKLKKYIDMLTPRVKNYNLYLYTTSLYRLELHKDIQFGIFDPGSNSLAELDNLLLKKKFPMKTNDIFNYYLLIYYNFGINNYDRATFWFNILMKYKNENIRNDCYSASLIIIILIHYERKNFQLVDSLLKSSFITNISDIEEKEYFKIFRNNINKLMNNNSEINLKFLYNKFINEINLYLKKYPLKIELLNFFDLKKYLRAKVNNYKFLDLKY